MVGHGGNSACSYLSDPTSPHPLLLCCNYPVGLAKYQTFVMKSFYCMLRLKYEIINWKKPCEAHRNPFGKRVTTLVHSCSKTRTNWSWLVWNWFKTVIGQFWNRFKLDLTGLKQTQPGHDWSGITQTATNRWQLVLTWILSQKDAKGEEFSRPELTFSRLSIRCRSKRFSVRNLCKYHKVKKYNYKSDDTYSGSRHSRGITLSKYCHNIWNNQVLKINLIYLPL